MTRQAHAGTTVIPARVDGKRPWEAVPAAHRAPVRAWAARRLVLHAANRLPVRTVIGDGGPVPEPGEPVLRIHRPDAFFGRLGTQGGIGFGEGYIAGDWSAEDLAGLLTPIVANISRLLPRPLRPLRRLIAWRAAIDNSPDMARRNATRHYDLSNELFALFLDETMTYSAAWFGDGVESLAQAQRRKVDAVLDMAGVAGGTSLLELGGGWGELALRAAGRGARVTSFNVSNEQVQYTRGRLREAGRQDQVEVVQDDFRAVTGRYDAVASVEMLEAVGHRHWGQYFSVVDDALRPGGRFALQTIVTSHDRMLTTRDHLTWIRKYIFPGGEIPSEQAIGDVARRTTSLTCTHRRSLGPSYALTLHLWRKALLENAEAAVALGFDERFLRMWEFYLALSEAGFRSGDLDVLQLQYVKA